MKIAVISDIHENFHNLILSLQVMEKKGVKQIICLGDLMNPGIAKVLAFQSIPVHMIWGNNDGDKVEITLAASRDTSVMTVGVTTYDFLEFDGKKIFITHYDDLALPMAQTRNYDAVFYGHNHEVLKDKEGDCWLVNPGELAASKTGKATMAIYDTTSNDVEIITLEGSVTLKTPLMSSYLKENASKMALRSERAFGISAKPKDV